MKLTAKEANKISKEFKPISHTKDNDWLFQLRIIQDKIIEKACKGYFSAWVAEIGTCLCKVDRKWSNKMKNKLIEELEKLGYSVKFCYDSYHTEGFFNINWK